MLVLLYLGTVTILVVAKPQVSEIQNDREKQSDINKVEVQSNENYTNVNDISLKNYEHNSTDKQDNAQPYKRLVGTSRNSEPCFIIRVYKYLIKQISIFITTPKVKSVMRNVGTCAVNGAMELITFYLPSPAIPLIATAASMIMPFEPVVMLRRHNPINSYKKALGSAISSFLGQFQTYDGGDDDPYMEKRFNRRFMNNDKSERKQAADGQDNNLLEEKDVSQQIKS